MRKFGKIYAALLMLLVIAVEILFVVIFFDNVNAIFGCMLGLLVSCFLAPVFHELGHYAFAAANKLKVVYIKCAIFRFERRNKKLRFSFANPFYADETQVMPASSGNMQKRARAYAIGGLVFGGFYLFILVAATVLTFALGVGSYLLLGSIPYAAYLFFLNVAPVEYALGKTDALVARGIRKGEPSEQTMLVAMEIQGCLSEGKRFAEIDESVYFNLPQLPEDDPMYAMILFLRYRFYLDKNDLAKAGDCLNRLAASAEYLNAIESIELSSELTYMHSLNGNKAAADDCAKNCEEYFASEDPSALRVLTAYSLAFGEKEKTEILLKKAYEALETEPVEGVKRFERALLDSMREKLSANQE
ncbi:MAG: hypothetical protein IJB97_09200 [Clostridia bacterium]|nr:hypothetical protein [Clostridia bacterium]